MKLTKTEIFSHNNPEGLIEDEVYRLVSRGNKIGLIKLVRTVTGLGLREAKHSVDQHCHADGTLDSGYDIARMMIDFYYEELANNVITIKGEIKDIDKSDSDLWLDRFEEVMSIVRTNWQALGYPSPKEMIQDYLRRN